MTRLLAVVLFVCSTAATQASTEISNDLVLGEFVTGALITATAFNLKNRKIESTVNGQIQLVAENKLNITNQNLQISGLSTRVDSCIALPSGCTAGQSLTFNGSALVCTDILPVTCDAGQIINWNGSAWQCHDDM